MRRAAGLIGTTQLAGLRNFSAARDRGRQGANPALIAEKSTIVSANDRARLV